MRPFVNLPPRARGAYMLQVVGRLKPGVAIEAAERDLSAVAAASRESFRRRNAGRGVRLEPLHDALIGGDLQLDVAAVPRRRRLRAADLLRQRRQPAAGAGHRAHARARDPGGARRRPRRIVRQLLTESLVLSLLGGALGLGVGAAILSVAPVADSGGPAARRRHAHLRPAPRRLLRRRRAPRRPAVRPRPGLAGDEHSRRPQAMGSDSRTTTGGGGELAQPAGDGRGGDRRAAAVRRGAAAAHADRRRLVRSRLSRRERPVDARRSARLEYPTAGVAAAVLRPGRGARSGPPPASQMSAWTSALPLDIFDFDGGFVVRDRRRSAARPKPAAEHRLPGRQPPYFSTLDLPIVAGRAFDAPRHARRRARLHRQRGLRHGAGRAIADRPARRAARRRLAAGQAGRARDCRRRPSGQGPAGRDEGLRPGLRAARPGPVDDVFLVVRPASGAAEALAPSVRAAIVARRQGTARQRPRHHDPRRHRVGGHRPPPVPRGDGLAFAALALVLAMVGVFGILAYSVQQRVRDFGVRRALGATTADVLRLVVADAVRVVASRRRDRPRPVGGSGPPDRRRCCLASRRWTSRPSPW